MSGVVFNYTLNPVAAFPAPFDARFGRASARDLQVGVSHVVVAAAGRAGRHPPLDV